MRHIGTHVGNGRTAPSATSTEEILADLVGFDTVSDRSNRELIDYVVSRLSAAGVPHVLSRDVGTDKVALLATIGPMRDGGIVLSGHTDVVPVADQTWTGDPFVLRRDGDKLTGRGSTDMKGFCAAVLSAVPAFVAADLERPVHVLLSYDEETTGLGSVDLIGRFGRSLPLPAGAIVGEPTGMTVATAHKGVTSFETVVTGVEAHSSQLNEGVSALLIGCGAVRFLERRAAWLKISGGKDPRFDSPCTTVHVGRMCSGGAVNIVPGKCRLAWEVRGLPGFDVRQVVRELDEWVASELPKLVWPRHAVEAITMVTEEVSSLPALVDGGDPTLASLALRLSGTRETGTVSFGTEAGHFQAAGIPAVVCGPGSARQAHRPDEYIELAQLRLCESFLSNLREELTS